MLWQSTKLDITVHPCCFKAFLEGKHKITAIKKQNLLYFSGSYFSVKFTNMEFLHENCLHFFQEVTLCFRLKRESI